MFSLKRWWHPEISQVHNNGLFEFAVFPKIIIFVTKYFVLQGAELIQAWAEDINYSMSLWL